MDLESLDGGPVDLESNDEPGVKPFFRCFSISCRLLLLTLLHQGGKFHCSTSRHCNWSICCSVGGAHLFGGVRGYDRR